MSRSREMMRRPVAGLLALVVVTTAGCATTIESDLTTTSAPASTSTTIPRGTVNELFDNIMRIGAGLGNDVASGDSGLARTKLADITATWQAIQPRLAPLGSDIVDDLTRLVGLYTTAVERKRPADADKATRFLGLAVEPLRQKFDSLGN